METVRCNREKCESYSCYTHIDNIGYICDDCEIEFKDHLYREHKNLSTNEDIVKELKIFMETQKSEFPIEDLKIEEFFNENRV
tara:strand:- start:9530 stop:9778 length:249 start_codon:yes stop_codon:yes gene_type:complete